MTGKVAQQVGSIWPDICDACGHSLKDHDAKSNECKVMFADRVGDPLTKCECHNWMQVAADVMPPEDAL